MPQGASRTLLPTVCPSIKHPRAQETKCRAVVWRAAARSLFVAKSDQWIDGGGAAGGDVASGDGNGEKKKRNTSKRERVVRAYAKELIGHQPRQGQRCDDAHGDPGERHARAVAEDQPQ